MLDPLLNCHSVFPVSASSATNSPVIVPVNTSPPSVTSVPAELGRSVSGTSHFFSPVSGLIATKWPSTSPGLIVGGRLTTPVESAPSTCGFGGGSLLGGGRFHHAVWMRPGVGFNAVGTAVEPRSGQAFYSFPAKE